MDDLRLGRLARALRRRLRLRQADVAARSGTSQDLVSLLERGRVGSMSLARIRRIFAVFDAEVVVYVRWRGGAADRLLDERHAALADVATALLEGVGWTVVPEVTYSIWGERGSIDLLAWHPATRTLLVIELKTEIASVEETLRLHDAKVRLAPNIARDQLDWDPLSIGRLLVLPEDRTARRQIDRHRAVFESRYPTRNHAVRRWLRSPIGSLGGILFLTGTNPVRTRQASRRR